MPNNTEKSNAIYAILETALSGIYAAERIGVTDAVERHKRTLSEFSEKARREGLGGLSKYEEKLKCHKI